MGYSNRLWDKSISIAKGKFIILFQKIVDLLSLLLFLPFAIPKIRNFRHASSKELSDFCFLGVFGLLRPVQIKSEVLEFINYLYERNGNRLVLEIGTARGGTLFLFSRLACADATIISVDLPTKATRLKLLLQKAIPLSGQQMQLIRADSHNVMTLQTVKDIVRDKNVDFLFIDGDHSYSGVKQDFELYQPLVKEGLIAFHDIVAHDQVSGCGVDRFWREVREHFPYDEIIYDNKQSWGGIGILYKNI